MKPAMGKAYAWWMNYLKKLLSNALTVTELEQWIAEEDLEFDLESLTVKGKSNPGQVAPHPEDAVPIAGDLINDIALYLNSNQHSIVQSEVRSWSSVVRTTVKSLALNFLDDVRDEAERRKRDVGQVLREANNEFSVLAALVPPRVSEQVRASTPSDYFDWLLDLGCAWEDVYNGERIREELEEYHTEIVQYELSDRLYLVLEDFFKQRHNEFSSM
jgi:hypothetical protein